MSTAKLRIELDAAAIKPLVARILRLDVGNGEPQCLASDITIAAGEVVQIALHEGATILLQEL